MTLNLWKLRNPFAPKPDPAPHLHALPDMVVITEQQFKDEPDRFITLRAKGKQIGIKGPKGNLVAIVGTAGRSAKEEKKDAAELEKLLRELQ